MANSVTVQLLEDGPRNVILKIDGYLDTSDVAVTGTIGASGFTTITNSSTVTFVAGALVPTVGQYLTFSDGTTTFVAGTYVTNIISATQIKVSTKALATNNSAAITITGSTGVVAFVGPAQLSYMWEGGEQYATQLRINKVQFSVDEGLCVSFFWEATSNLRIFDLVRTGKLDFRHFGGVSNNAGAGKTGSILLSTEGWSSGKILEFTVLLELVKQ